MEKKVPKKAAVRKKAVEPKTIEPISPWAEIAAAPLKKRAAKPAPKAVSEPEAAASGKVSEPGAVATGSRVQAEVIPDPVATAPGSDTL